MPDGYNGITWGTLQYSLQASCYDLALYKGKVGLMSQAYGLVKRNAKDVIKLEGTEGLWQFLNDNKTSKTATTIEVGLALSAKLEDDSLFAPDHLLIDTGSSEENESTSAWFDSHMHDSTSKQWDPSSPPTQPAVTVTTSSAARRIEGRAAVTSTVTRTTAWLDKMIRSQNSILYQSMNRDMYNVSVQFLSNHKVKINDGPGNLVPDLYTLKDDDPTTWPQAMTDVFPSMKIFQVYGEPKKDAYPLDENGQPPKNPLSDQRNTKKGGFIAAIEGIKDVFAPIVSGLTPTNAPSNATMVASTMTPMVLNKPQTVFFVRSLAHGSSEDAAVSIPCVETAKPKTMKELLTSWLLNNPNLQEIFGGTTDEQQKMRNGEKRMQFTIGNAKFPRDVFLALTLNEILIIGNTITVTIEEVTKSAASLLFFD